MSIKDRIIVVAGAAGSLGPTLCRAFAQAGASLALVGSRLEPLQTLASELALPAGRVLAYAANLTDPASVNALAGAVKEKFGRADAVIHLVGGYKAGAPVTEMDLAEVTSMLDQHLWTTLHIARAFIPMMAANNWGRFVHIGTPVAQTPNAKQAPYAIGKAAQDTLMLVLAQELKDTGVTVNAIQIRSIETAPPDPAKPRTGSSPEEISAAVLWLCSDEAGATNGARIPVFGRA
ncbi:MAG: SDR family oxidoreductase [Chloroflexi bacterium]|nr:SDR family oxidoreductase [Chloroflexota bacterium]